MQMLWLWSMLISYINKVANNIEIKLIYSTELITIQTFFTCYLRLEIYYPNYPLLQV